MSATIEKDVQGLISSIGYLERDGVYYREPDCFRIIFLFRASLAL